jgi:UDP-N-acetylmuramate: L-alanyl-gamma-D-glutamyl-meso-diaminopimelate ligase
LKIKIWRAMNLSNMRVEGELGSLRDQIKKIFFYRVCGTGMGACACLAREAGFEVAGADITFSPPMSTYLESQDIDLFSLDDLTTEQLSTYDLIVVGNSVPRMSEADRTYKPLEFFSNAFNTFGISVNAFLLKSAFLMALGVSCTFVTLTVSSRSVMTV